MKKRFFSKRFVPTGFLFLTSPRKQKAQAALEFLLTYGWAILTTIIMIGVLAYFGVFDSESYIGSGIALPPFYIKSWLVDQNSVSFELENKGGSLVDIEYVTLATEKEEVNCAIFDERKSADVGKSIIVDSTCSGLTPGELFNGELIIAYTKEGSYLLQYSRGAINDIVKASAANEESHNFQFTFSEDGFLQELYWTKSGMKKIVWDEKDRLDSWARHYSHSTQNSPSPNGWSYKIDNGPLIIENHNEIKYSKLSESSDLVEIKAEGSSFVVYDTLKFQGDTIYLTAKIENTLDKKIEVNVPINLGALQINDAERYRLRATRGGYIEEWKGLSPLPGSPYNYPLEIGAFSPVSALWDSQFIIAQQYLTELRLPTNVEFNEKPFSKSSELLSSTITTQLATGQSKEFLIAFQLANSGDWRSALAPYKEWFQTTYGSTPSYCPAPAFSFFLGRNSCAFNNPDCANYNPNLGQRYHEGQKLNGIYLGSSNKVIDNMNALNLEYYGIWGSALYSTYLTSDHSEFEFNPTIELIDPNIDAGTAPQKINEFTQLFRDNNKKVFWFARPCDDINGADISVTEVGTEFIKGEKKIKIDLTNSENKDKMFTRLDFFVSRGVDGFYVDTMSCPGDEKFLLFAKEKFKTLYNKEIFFIKEGARDRDALLWPQIPLLKTPNYIKDNSLLIEFLTPSSTFYSGKFNQHLSDDEVNDILDKGYQPIIANSLFDIEDKYFDWLQKAKQNQLAKQLPNCPNI